jgi:bifunctional DNA-binding transcriptional regulator/antitoxin component of YhaV-PrlF toxin-antitoxin module
MVTEFAVKLTTDGMIPVPESLQRELGLKPQQTVYLRLDSANGGLVIQLVTRQEVGDRLLALTREAFQEVTWADIQAGRRSDAYRS